MQDSHVNGSMPPQQNKVRIDSLSQLACHIVLSGSDPRSQIQSSHPPFFRNRDERIFLSESGIILNDEWVLFSMAQMGYFCVSTGDSRGERSRLKLRKHTSAKCHVQMPCFCPKQQHHQEATFHSGNPPQSPPQMVNSHPETLHSSSSTVQIPIVELIYLPCENQKKWLTALMGRKSIDPSQHSYYHTASNSSTHEWHLGWNPSQDNLNLFGGLVLGRLHLPISEYCKELHSRLHETTPSMEHHTSSLETPCCNFWRHHNWLRDNCTPSVEHIAPSEASNSRPVPIRHGESIYIVGSPFGITSPNTFQNSITRGIISNVLGGREPYLLLTDGRMLPGCEGGPIFSCNYFNESDTQWSPASLHHANTPQVLLGVAALPVRNVSEKVEMNVSYSFEPIRREIVEILKRRQSRVSPQPESHQRLVLQYPSDLFPQINSTHSFASIKAKKRNNIAQFPHSYSPQLKEAIEAVVRVQVSNSWASGILIQGSNHRSFVLTNAHVFAPFLDATLLKNRKSQHTLRDDNQHIPLSYPILMTQHKFDQHSSIISHSFLGDLIAIVDDGPLDLALISVASPIASSFSCGIHINYKQRLQTGEDVYVVGHPLYDPNLNLNPTVTAGTLAKVVRYKGLPTLIQTSALVHSGNSGGMVVSKKGKMLGIVTSNANLYDPNTKTNKLIPSLNFAVPVSRMKDIQEFIDGNLSLHQLDEALNHMDDAVTKVWSLQENDDSLDDLHASVQSRKVTPHSEQPLKEAPKEKSPPRRTSRRDRTSALMKYLQEMNQSKPQHMIPKSKL